MLTLFEFSQHIANLKMEKKYSEAILYFKENKNKFTKEQIANNEYIVSNILTCLRHSNQLDAGFQFLKIYGIEINAHQKERILNAYGWLLWAKYKEENHNHDYSPNEDDFLEDEDEEVTIQDFEYKKSELLKKIEDLIQILFSFNNDFIKTLISNLFLIVLKSEKKKATPNWKLINEFCNFIDKEKLSKECSTIKVERKGKLKEMEMASDFENWYAYKTNALAKLGKWQECFNLSKEALEKIKKFHYSNDVWFSRRIALSKKNLGITEDAIQELHSILKKKREWFIQKELAELYFENGNFESALKQAIDGMNNFGQLEFKVDLLYLLGKILRQQGNLELSFQHFSLSKLIRQSEEWKLPKKLLDELRTFNFLEIPQKDFNKLKNEIQKYWDSFKTSQTNDKSKTTTNIIIEGEIVKFIHNNEKGKVGFIRSKGKEYYFSVDPNFHSFSKITLGTKVFFEIKQATDDNKEKARIKKVIV